MASLQLWFRYPAHHIPPLFLIFLAVLSYFLIRGPSSSIPPLILFIIFAVCFYKYNPKLQFFVLWIIWDIVALGLYIILCNPV